MANVTQENGMSCGCTMLCQKVHFNLPLPQVRTERKIYYRTLKIAGTKD